MKKNICFLPSLQTERLVLSSLRACDREPLIALFRDEVVTQSYMVPDLDDASADKLFCRIRELSEGNTRFVRGIFLRGELIGIVNDVGIEGDCIELGYAISSSHHGKGYMTEVLSSLILHLKALGFQRIRAGAFSENKASIRVMEKCGMRKIPLSEEIEYRSQKHSCVYYEI